MTLWTDAKVYILTFYDLEKVKGSSRKKQEVTKRRTIYCQAKFTH